MRNARSAAIALVVIGIGMGGFVDGIGLHQILQWHNMLSNPYPPDSVHNMRINMLADGLFHAFSWLVSFLGIVLLWRAARRGDAMPATARFFGALILGWGLFNLVEGLIDHQILGIHDVYPGRWHTVANLAFLGVGGLGFIVVGILLMRVRPTSPFHARR